MDKSLLIKRIILVILIIANIIAISLTVISVVHVTSDVVKKQKNNTHIEQNNTDGMSENKMKIENEIND